MVPLTNLVNIHSLVPSFLEEVLKPTVFEVVDRINNDDMWKKITNDLLMTTRSKKQPVRFAAFSVIENLFARMGERYLILLNDTLPFLSEGLEDENAEVEVVVKTII